MWLDTRVDTERVQGGGAICLSVSTDGHSTLTESLSVLAIWTEDQGPRLRAGGGVRAAATPARRPSLTL